MKYIVTLAMSLLLAACSTDFTDVNQAPPLSPVGSGISQAQPVVVPGGSPFQATDASWDGGAADYFRDARARKVGDIITVRIAINDSASLNNTSSRSRKSSTDGSIDFGYSMFGVSPPGMGGSHKADGNSSAQGQGATVRSEQIDLSVAAIVTQLLPNGYLVIDGTQEVLVNYEQRVLKVAGIVHPGDITPDNSISYEKIAEARISYGGKGRITEVQQPGWAQQFWDKVAPF